MKKLLFTIFIITFFLGSTSYGQFHFSVGPRVGINIANASFDPELPSGVDNSTRLGFKFGALAELGFSPMFAVQIEPMYAMKGTEIEFQGGTTKWKLSYIEIPVLLKVKFAAGSLTPYVFAGPNIGILLSANSETALGEEDVKDQFASTDFVVDFGAGIGILVSPGVIIMLDARYALGLSDLNKSDDPNVSDYKIKSTGIQILAGAMFGLN